MSVETKTVTTCDLCGRDNDLSYKGFSLKKLHDFDICSCCFPTVESILRAEFDERKKTATDNRSRRDCQR